jgi:hypothetical protein
MHVVRGLWRARRVPITSNATVIARPFVIAHGNPPWHAWTIALGAIVMLVSACSRQSPPPTSATVVRDSAGIVIVENDHTRPIWEAATVWRLSAEPVLRIGRAEGERAQLLDRVIHSRRLPFGAIAVTNSGNADVPLFDLQGRHLATLGRRGDGPGEFREPWLVFDQPGDSILVIDLNGRSSVFDRNGDFVRQFRVTRPNREFQGIEPVGLFGDGTLLYRALLPDDPLWTGVVRTSVGLFRFDRDGGLRGTLGDVPDQTLTLSPQFRGPLLYGPRAYSATVDSTLWYGPGDRFELREIAFDGRILRVLRLDVPVKVVAAEDVAVILETYRARYRGTSREQASERLIAAMPVAEVQPAHLVLHVDAGRNLWVQEHQYPEIPRPRHWFVFDPGGRYLGRVETPTGLDVHQIGDDFVLGRWRDELDIEYILMYRLEKPKS